MSELPKFKNLVEMAVLRAADKGHKPLMSFMGEDGSRESLMTFRGLDASSRAIAALLMNAGLRGKNVLLLYAPGLEYIKGFFGCLYAGAVPVPAYPPMGAKDLERLASIARDCDAAAILSTASLAPMIQAWLSNPANGMNLACYATDTAESAACGSVDVFDAAPDDIAFLQYTSGSTGHPKGVMVTHGNLIANFGQILDSFAGMDSPDATLEHYKTVIWLPPFHDMGLIGGVLTPVYAGASVTLMSPLTFLKNPFLWLKAITEDKAMVSGGPNFSYQYCVRKITEEQKQQLDLSSWQVAFNGAEAIHADSLRKFATHFAGCGFESKAFLPCYGLAEATLFVAGAPARRGAQVKTMRLNEAADNDNISELVSCGVKASHSDIVIVDPNSCVPMPAGEVGEIWVNSPSVCAGYWKKPTLSESVFRARAVGVEGNTFLRTGDLGFIENGELYVTGRIKELIIVAGRNHYPQDIEATVQAVSDTLRKGCGAAFSARVHGKEQVVLVQEINLTQSEPAYFVSLVMNVVRAVSQRHGISLSALVLIRSGTLPKTSSGKIQRTEAKRMFESDQLDVVHRWNNFQTSHFQTSNVQTNNFQALGNQTGNSQKNNAHKINVIGASREERRSMAVYIDWSTELYAHMQAWVADKLNVDSQHVHLDVTFSELGIDSIEAIDVVDRLQAYLGRPIHATEMLRYPTVKALLDHLGQELQARQVTEANLLHADSGLEKPASERVRKIGLT